MPPTSNDSPNGSGPPRVDPVTDDVANVLGRVTIVAVLGWLLAAAEFLALIVCTRGCAH